MTTVFIEDKVFLHYNEYPEDLLSSWILFTTFDEKSPFGGICALYINDKHPKGTIIYSNAIGDDAPDSYVTWHKNGKINRVYTSNKYRGLGIVTTLGALTRTLLYFKNNLYLEHSYDPTEIADNAMATAIGKILNEKDQSKVRKSTHWKQPSVNGKEMVSTRDPVPPAYWYSESEYLNEC